MVTRTTAYCQLGAYDFTEHMYSEGVEPSGGALEVDDITSPGRNYADVQTKGRQAKKYKLHMASDDREIIEAFTREANNVSDGDPFYPFEAQRFGEVAVCHSSISPKLYANTWYNGEAVVVCKDPWLYGPDKGIAYKRRAVLPYVSDLLTNEGHETTPISYMLFSGGVLHIEDLSIRITPETSDAEMDQYLLLCTKMMRGDKFRVGWRGDIIHSYRTVFQKSWQEISRDLHSMTSGGVQASQKLTLDNGDYLMMPFYGPHLITGESGAAEIKLTLDAITGDSAQAQLALETALSDMVEVDHDDLVLGENTIYFSGLEGESFVAIGLKAAAAGSVTISEISGQVKRFVSPSQIPVAQEGDSFKIRVEAAAGNRLHGLQVAYNDRYYY